MDKRLLIAGSVICFFGVAFGAFGAHALSSVLQGKAAGWFETAVDYQFIHGLALILCAVLSPVLGRSVNIVGFMMLTGSIIFCGTLYAMALGAPRWLGMITPVGGACLLCAWGILAWSAILYDGLNGDNSQARGKK